QTLQAGSTFNITWSATGASNIASYEVRYSTDDGATFPITNLILSTSDSSVTQTAWIVPDTPTTHARLRVQASTKSASAVTAISGAFVIGGSGTGSPAPIITSVTQNGKQLFVNGQNFLMGAKVQLNGEGMKTANQDDFTHQLFCKKAGKFIAPGSTVMLTVTNPDGTMSAPFPYMRPTNERVRNDSSREVFRTYRSLPGGELMEWITITTVSVLDWLVRQRFPSNAGLAAWLPAPFSITQLAAP